jgi:hypothetical protein
MHLSTQLFKIFLELPYRIHNRSTRVREITHNIVRHNRIFTTSADCWDAQSSLSVCQRVKERAPRAREFEFEWIKIKHASRILADGRPSLQFSPQPG